MNKTEGIARRILGWKLNRWDRWYDYEAGKFIYDTDFQPEKNLEHAMLIVEKLEDFGFSYSPKGNSEVCFNNVMGKGETLPQAITDAAYSIIEMNSMTNSTDIWN